MSEKIKHRRIGCKNEGSFSSIHDRLKGYINEIEGRGAALYWMITTHCIGKEYCWVSQERLAMELNWSLPTIIKYMKKLENAKLIKREKRGNKTNIIHLLRIKPRDIKNFNDRHKESLRHDIKNFNDRHKESLPKSYKEKHIKRNRVKETIAKFDVVDRYFNKLVDMFNEGFKKLNKTNKGKAQQSISSLNRLNSEDVKKKEIKEVLLWYLNPENMCMACMPKINSVKEFCESFHRVRTIMDEVDED